MSDGYETIVEWSHRRDRNVIVVEPYNLDKFLALRDEILATLKRHKLNKYNSVLALGTALVDFATRKQSGSKTPVTWLEYEVVWLKEPRRPRRPQRPRRPRPPSTSLHLVT
jgi:hypothetical protein